MNKGTKFFDGGGLNLPKALIYLNGKTNTSKSVKNSHLSVVVVIALVKELEIFDLLPQLNDSGWQNLKSHLSVSPTSNIQCLKIRLEKCPCTLYPACFLYWSRDGRYLKAEVTAASSCEKPHRTTGKKELRHAVAAAKEISMNAAMAAVLKKWLALRITQKQLCRL